jgi:hypothetical protein
MNQLYGTYKTEQTSVLLSAIPNAETFVKAPFQKRILSYLEIKWYSLHSKLYVV